MTTNHQNHNQITNLNPNPQPHHHQQSEKEKEKQPPRDTYVIRDPCRTLNQWPTPIYPQRWCSRRSETHEPRPTKSNHTTIKLYLHISGSTLKAKSIYCPVVFGLLMFRSTNLGGEGPKLWNWEKQKLRGKREEKSKKGKRRKKRKKNK